MDSSDLLPIHLARRFEDYSVMWKATSAIAARCTIAELELMCHNET